MDAGGHRSNTATTCTIGTTRAKALLGAHIAIYKERKPSFAKDRVAKRCQHGGTAETLDARQKRQRTERSSQGGSSSHSWQREPVCEPVESTEIQPNRPKLFLGQVFVELWRVQVGDQCRLWQVLDPPQPSRWSRAELKLEPCWGQVEIFWSRKCDFGGLEKQY